MARPSVQANAQSMELTLLVVRTWQRALKLMTEGPFLTGLLGAFLADDEKNLLPS